MPKTPRQQNPGLKNITAHVGHDGTRGLLAGLDHYLDSGGSLNQLRAFIYGEWTPTKDGHHIVRRTGTGLEVTACPPPAPPIVFTIGADEHNQPHR